MTASKIPEWVAQQHRNAQNQFTRFYEEYARKNQNDYDAVQAEIHNLFLAMHHFFENNQHQQVIDLLNYLDTFFLHRGYWREGIEWLEKILPSAERLYKDDPTQEKNLYSLASLQITLVGFLLLQGSMPEAIAIFQQVLNTDGLLNNNFIVGGWTLLAGVIAELVHGKSKDVISLYEDSLEKIQPSENLQVISETLSMMASVLADQGEYEKAIDLYWKKLDIDRQSKDVRSIIESYRGLAEIAQHAGLSDVADQCYQDAAELADAAFSPVLRQVVLGDLARSAYQKEDYATAVTLYEKALAIAREMGNKSETATILSFLAFAKEELGEEIIHPLEECLAIYRDLNDYSGMTMAMIQLGDAHQAKQSNERAKELYSQAKDIATRINNSPLIALSWLQLGDLALAQEDGLGAQACFEQSLVAHSRYDEPSSRAMVLHRLGQAYLIQEKLQEAKDVIQMSANLYNDLRDWDSYAGNLYALARITAREGKVEEARDLAQQSLNILAKIRSDNQEEVDNFIKELET